MRQAPKLRAAVSFGATFALSCFVAGIAHAQLQPDPTVNQTQSDAPAPAKPFAGFGAGRLALESNQPLNLEGDELIYDSSGQRVTARGNVVITFNNYVLRANEVVYDQGAGTLTAVGNVRLRDPSGNVTTGERIVLTDDFRDGFVQALSVRTSDDTRITARRAIRRDGQTSVFEDGKFTPCKSEAGRPPLWCIAAARVTHDQAKGRISYQDAEFRFFGVPVVYVPYFEHADPSTKRKSGFLLPGYEASSERGFGVTIPYYFALSPSYDFTFSPRYMTEQGVMWQGEWRQKLAIGAAVGQYRVSFAAIDQNAGDLPGAFNEDLDGWRGTVETVGQFSLSSWWRLGWDVTLESDDTFRRFYKFDNVLITNRVNTAYLIGQSERNYFSMIGYHFGGLQLQETSTSESRVHPVIDWNYIVGQPVLGGELSWNFNAVSLTRDGEAVDAGDLNSSHNRISADINWRRKLMDRVGITYEPFANLRGDALLLDDVVNGVTSQSDSDTSVRGTASAGVLAAYPWLAAAPGGAHVVEPLGQVIFRRSANASEKTPNEDARSVYFDDTNLFELDKFSGYDRVEIGSRANVGVQYTFQANSGGYARLLAGQSFRLDGRNAFADAGSVVTRDGETEPGITQRSGLETDRSDYVLGVYLAPSRVFSLAGQSRFDENDYEVERADVFASFNYGPFRASANYTYISADLANRNSISTLGTDEEEQQAQQEIVANIGLQITQNWRIATGMRYDIDRAFRIAESFQVKYSDECFVLSVTYTSRNLENAAGDIENDDTVMLRFDLKHIGQFQTQAGLDLLDGSDS